MYLLKMALYLAEGELANAQRNHLSLCSCLVLWSSAVPHLCHLSDRDNCQAASQPCTLLFAISLEAQMKAAISSRCDLVLVILRRTRQKAIMSQLFNKQSKICLDNRYQETGNLGLKFKLSSPCCRETAAEKQMLKDEEGAKTSCQLTYCGFSPCLKQFTFKPLRWIML